MTRATPTTHTANTTARRPWRAPLALALAAACTLAGCGGGGYDDEDEAQTPAAQGLNPALSLVAGSGTESGCVDGALEQARFGSLQGLAQDRNGNVYVADAGCHAVRRISALGVVSTVAGQLGVAGDAFGGVGVSRMQAPAGVRVESDDNPLFPTLIVTDGVTARLSRIDASALELQAFVSGPALIGARDIAGIADDVAWLSGAADLGVLDSGVGVSTVSTGLPDTLTALAPQPVSGLLLGATPTALRIGLAAGASDGPGTLLAGDDREVGSQDGIGSAARFTRLAGLDVAVTVDGEVAMALDGDALRRVDITVSGDAIEARVRTVLTGIGGLGTPRKLLIAPDGRSVLFTTPTAVVRAALPASDTLVRP